MITLYGFGSPNVLKVLIALEELSLPYRCIFIDVFKGDQYSNEFGKLTLNRKVPVIVDEEGPGGTPLTLWESGAILIHLAEKAGSLIPADARERLIALQWLMFQMAGIGPMFGQQVHFRLYAPNPEYVYSRTRYTTEVRRLYDVVEKRLNESEYIGGREYSIADIAAWPWMQRAEARAVDLSTLPATKRWIETLRARPAVIRAKQVFDSWDMPDVPRLMREETDAVDRYLGRGKYSRGEE